MKERKNRSLEGFLKRDKSGVGIDSSNPNVSHFTLGKGSQAKN